MQEYSKVNKEKELASVFFCDIVFQQSTQTVQLLNYWLKCRELISFFGREARGKTIKLTHCMSATNTKTNNNKKKKTCSWSYLHTDMIKVRRVFCFCLFLLFVFCLFLLFVFVCFCCLFCVVLFIVRSSG